jgi:hypothetical protein
MSKALFGSLARRKKKKQPRLKEGRRRRMLRVPTRSSSRLLKERMLARRAASASSRLQMMMLRHMHLLLSTHPTIHQKWERHLLEIGLYAACHGIPAEILNNSMAGNPLPATCEHKTEG